LIVGNENFYGEGRIEWKMFTPNLMQIQTTASKLKRSGHMCSSTCTNACAQRYHGDLKGKYLLLKRSVSYNIIKYVIFVYFVDKTVADKKTSEPVYVLIFILNYVTQLWRKHLQIWRAYINTIAL
jgi:hypothetical protein